MIAVETDVREVKEILRRLEPAITALATRTGKLSEDVAELRGRVSQLPTTLQMVGFILAVLATGGLMRHFFP